MKIMQAELLNKRLLEFLENEGATVGDSILAMNAAIFTVIKTYAEIDHDENGGGDVADAVVMNLTELHRRHLKMADAIWGGNHE